MNKKSIKRNLSWVEDCLYRLEVDIDRLRRINEEQAKRIDALEKQRKDEVYQWADEDEEDHIENISTSCQTMAYALIGINRTLERDRREGQASRPFGK